MNQPTSLTQHLKAMLLVGAAALAASQQQAKAAAVPEEKSIDQRVEALRQKIEKLDQQGGAATNEIRVGNGSPSDDADMLWWRNAWGNGGWGNWHNGWHNWRNGGWGNWHNW